MPTYEYACKECGEHVEAVQAFTDDPLTVCASCGGPLRKVFGDIGISFKGSGFYKNDSRASTRSSGSTSDTTGEGSAAKEPKESSDGKADTAAKGGPAKGEPAKGPAKSEPAATRSEPAKPAAAAS